MNLTLWWNILHVLPHSVITINTKAWMSWGKHGHRILQLLPSRGVVHFSTPGCFLWQIACDWSDDVRDPQPWPQGASPLLGCSCPQRKEVQSFFYWMTSPQKERERSIWQPMTRHQPCEWGHFIPSGPRPAAKFYNHISESKQEELSSSNGKWWSNKWWWF